MTGQVYKAHSDKYAVKLNGEVITCTARGILKWDREKIAVGDFVEVENGAIKRVVDRKNIFIRPFVSNVDVIVAVISPKPKPDFYLIDKLLINAIKEDVKVIFAVNKTDIDSALFDSVCKNYEKLGIEILPVSAKENKGVDQLKEKLKGKLTVFAGQSAVGKTSLINAMFNLNLKTGDLSEKIERGKHTTTYSEIHEYGDVKVIDSPGFAVIEAFIKAEEIPEYYPEYFELSSKCKFRGCTHTSEPNCEVKRAVLEGKLDKERYDRYLEIYNELLKRRDFL